MYAANTFAIRPATDHDAYALRRLARLNSRAPLHHPVLIGDLAGQPAAAISIADQRVLADPNVRADHLAAALRIRAGAIRAFRAQPALRERMLAALPARHRRHASRHGAAEPTGIEILRPQAALAETAGCP